MKAPNTPLPWLRLVTHMEMHLDAIINWQDAANASLTFYKHNHSDMTQMERMLEYTILKTRERRAASMLSTIKATNRSNKYETAPETADPEYVAATKMYLEYFSAQKEFSEHLLIAVDDSEHVRLLRILIQWRRGYGPLVYCALKF